MDACMRVCQVTSVVSDSLRLLRTVALQALLSVGFPRQEYWSGLPFPPPGDLPDPAIKHRSPALAGGFFTTQSPGFHFHLKPLIKSFKNTAESLGIY